MIHENLFIYANQDSTISFTWENLKMFNITWKYFSIFNKKPPTNWVAHVTRDFLTCYSCSYHSSMVTLTAFVSLSSVISDPAYKTDSSHSYNFKYRNVTFQLLLMVLNSLKKMFCLKNSAWAWYISILLDTRNHNPDLTRNYQIRRLDSIMTIVSFENGIERKRRLSIF